MENSYFCNYRVSSENEYREIILNRIYITILSYEYLEYKINWVTGSSYEIWTKKITRYGTD